MYRPNIIKSRFDNLFCNLKKQDNFLFFGLLILSGLLNVFRGQANWWDVINYHIYNPWSLLHHRWTVDFFASGIQGYFHPLLDMPYYMVSMVWFPGHPRIVAFLAGLPYGSLVFITYLIARRLINYVERAKWGERLIVTVLAVMLSVTGVSAWTQAGTTTNEVTVSTLVLISVYLLIRCIEDTKFQIDARSLFVIGALMGLAASLKLTATVYAPAMGLVILGTGTDIKSVLRAGIIYTSGWLLVFILIFGPWAWHVYSLTGDPMFPMFNNLFHSTFSAAVGGRDKISMPKNVWQWLFYPFFWINLNRPSVYNKLLFRDPRILIFYIVALVFIADYLYRSWRKRTQLVHRGVRLLIAFCVFSYVIWLVVFSMLRYAIVIEVIASLLTVIIVWNFANSSNGHLQSLPRILLLAGLVFAIMISTVYPNINRIRFSRNVYTASVPKLRKHALLILANQPMGLLAPLIYRKNKTTQFIGLPYCFIKGRWCYNGFYHYGLGRQLREKIYHHNGPIYVAYYANRMPTMPQLALFRVTVNYDQCEHMSTNATADVNICLANYTPPGKPLPKPEHVKEKYALNIHYELAGMRIKSAWLANTCGREARFGKLKFNWHLPEGQDYVHVFLQTPPADRLISFAAGHQNGTATTGMWVRSSQVFFFKTMSGKTLARASVRYVQCMSKE